ncbi:MAG: type IV toxin-antitoxin system AbiEi family antitoxin [Pseudomonadota bacterium]
MTTFFARNPVFTYDEFARFLESRGSMSRKTRDNLLDYHIKAGHVIRVTRGLFASVPPVSGPANAPVDAYLLASRMSRDAVLGYHTALELHGKAHSVHERFLYLTGHPRKTSSIEFRGHAFQGVLFPKALRDKGQEFFGVRNVNRAGLPVRVTSLERTLVDLMDRPDLGGGWEEIWKSLESVEFFDLDEVEEYALMLGNRTTVAKVGFYLEAHREDLMVEDRHLEQLRKHCPKQRTYMGRRSDEPRRTGYRLT